MKKKSLFTGFFLFIFLITLLCNTQVTEYHINRINLAVNPFTKVVNFFKDIFVPKTHTTILYDDDKYVYLGGNPIGFSLKSDGVVVVGISEFIDNDSYVSPGKNAGLKSGDIIKKIDGINITSSSSIGDILKAGDKKYYLEFIRNGEQKSTVISPVFDYQTKSYKLGLWVRDSATGVGTLTYTNEDGSFVALGHAVCDIDTGAVIPVLTGELYKTSIIGINKGKRGTPGELKGIFSKTSPIGSLNANSNQGIGGKFNAEEINEYRGEKIAVASVSEITPGGAIMYSCIDGNRIKGYEIEIIKITDSTNNTKNMILRVVDDELIEKCGGIVQGMSGSPIVQNGKLIGALTHVFINDPTKGYAIFCSNMTKN